jgi:D-beta-D-heptose 7-phosphate kinase/D-beta-D-heptose 1-phosphate adenosyltransferase
MVGQRERARALAAMAEADALVIFCQPAPLELIVVAQPAVLVKAGDYRRRLPRRRGGGR